MALLRVFVSSTCYDLHAVRAQIRTLVQGLGHEPVMSDYMEVLYNPSEHTHESCVKEVSACDLVVLVIGSRFGGTGVPVAIDAVDIEKLEEASFSTEVLADKENLSVTQLEICKAIESGVPVFAFVTNQVWHDHHVYEANKGSGILDKLQFPSVDKPETARYIFEFINFLRHRTSNNHIIAFSRVDEIEGFLKRQWSSLFQSLLAEQRSKDGEQRRLDLVSSELADLKAAVMSSIAQPGLRETARGAIRFRRLVDFISGLEHPDTAGLVQKDISWNAVLAEVGIVRTVPLSDRRSGPFELAMIRSDGTYYKVRYGERLLGDLSVDWEAWKQLSSESRSAILDAVSESGGSMRMVRFVPEPFEPAEPPGVTTTTTPEPDEDDAL